MYKKIKKSLSLVIKNILTIVVYIFIHYSPSFLIIVVRRLLETIIQYISIKEESVIHKNLKIVYKDTKTIKDRKIFVKKYKKIFIRHAIDMLSIAIKKQQMEIVGINHLHQVMQKNRGILFLSLHTNHFILFGMALKKHMSLWVLRKKLRLRQASKLEENLIVDTGHRYITITKNYHQPMKKIIRAMKNKEPMIFFFDQKFDDITVKKIDFFGRKTSVSSGILNMAMKFDVPIVPIYTNENEKGQYQLIIEEEIILKNTDNRKKDLDANLLSMNQFLEKCIKKHPYQWGGWMYNRWV